MKKIYFHTWITAIAVAFLAITSQGAMAAKSNLPPPPHECAISGGNSENYPACSDHGNPNAYRDAAPPSQGYVGARSTYGSAGAIDVYKICKYVSNTSKDTNPVDYFVPFGTLLEWQKFYNNAPKSSQLTANPCLRSSEPLNSFNLKYAPSDDPILSNGSPNKWYDSSQACGSAQNQAQESSVSLPYAEYTGGGQTIQVQAEFSCNGFTETAVVTYTGVGPSPDGTTTDGPTQGWQISSITYSGKPSPPPVLLSAQSYCVAHGGNTCAQGYDGAIDDNPAFHYWIDPNNTLPLAFCNDASGKYHSGSYTYALAALDDDHNQNNKCNSCQNVSYDKPNFNIATGTTSETHIYYIMCSNSPAITPSCPAETITSSVNGQPINLPNGYNFDISQSKYYVLFGTDGTNGVALGKPYVYKLSDHSVQTAAAINDIGRTPSPESQYSHTGDDIIPGQSTYKASDYATYKCTNHGWIKQ